MSVWELAHDSGPRGKLEEDITGRIVDLEQLDRRSLSGSDYDFRWTDGARKGQPFLPGVLYHAAKGAQLFDERRGSEVVCGSLTTGVLQSMFVAALRDSSHPILYGIGVNPRGVKVKPGVASDKTVAYMTTQAGAINFFDPSPDVDTQPEMGQFKPGADVDKLLASLQGKAAQIAEYAGVSPADLQRTSGDPRSGYALAISRSGLRSAQRRIEPQLREGDLALVERAAAMLNASSQAGLPEEGYSITFRALPLTAPPYGPAWSPRRPRPWPTGPLRFGPTDGRGSRAATCRGRRCSSACSTARRTAPDAADPSPQVQITHPFHPLSGQVFPRTGQRRSHHGDCVWLAAADGSTFSVPKRWTSELALTAFDQLAGGRAHFRPDDLRRLAVLVATLRGGSDDASGGGDV